VPDNLASNNEINAAATGHPASRRQRRGRAGFVSQKSAGRVHGIFLDLKAGGLTEFDLLESGVFVDFLLRSFT
jgi:hypothetical protein